MKRENGIQPLLSAISAARVVARVRLMARASAEGWGRVMVFYIGWRVAVRAGRTGCRVLAAASSRVWRQLPLEWRIVANWRADAKRLATYSMQKGPACITRLTIK